MTGRKILYIQGTLAYYTKNDINIDSNPNFLGPKITKIGNFWKIREDHHGIPVKYSKVYKHKS